MKKIILASVWVIFYLTASAFFISCYQTWLNAFNSATDEYGENLERCEDAWFSVRCIEETEVRYDYQIGLAGEAYYSCVNSGSAAY